MTTIVTGDIAKTEIPFGTQVRQHLDSIFDVDRLFAQFDDEEPMNEDHINGHQPNGDNEHYIAHFDQPADLDLDHELCDIYAAQDIATHIDPDAEIEYDDGLLTVEFANKEYAEAFENEVGELDSVEMTEIVELRDKAFASYLVIVHYNDAPFIYDADEDDDNDDSLDEVKRIVKVNSLGKRRIKMQCARGYKWNGSACVKISGSELAKMRLSRRKSIITKKSMGTGLKVRTLRKTRKAKRFRKSMGLK